MSFSFDFILMFFPSPTFLSFETNFEIALSLSLSYTAALKRTKCGVAVMLDPLYSMFLTKFLQKRNMIKYSGCYWKQMWGTKLAQTRCQTQTNFGANVINTADVRSTVCGVKFVRPAVGERSFLYSVMFFYSFLISDLWKIINLYSTQQLLLSINQSSEGGKSLCPLYYKISKRSQVPQRV